MSKYTVKVTKVTCKATTDPNGTDEVWMQLQPDGLVPVRYPEEFAETISMDPNSSFEPGQNGLDPLVVSFEHELLITLWEQDLAKDINLTDLLGSTDILPGSTPGTVIVNNGNDSNYEISWEWE